MSNAVPVSMGIKTKNATTGVVTFPVNVFSEKAYLVV